MQHFAYVRREGYFYAGKTGFVPWVESPERGNKYLLFLRPQRFGKSLLLSIVKRYYDIARAAAFDELFGGLTMHENPTPLKDNSLLPLLGQRSIKAMTLLFRGAKSYQHPLVREHCLFLGRTEDHKLKGLDIAAGSVAEIHKRGIEAVLAIRGAPAGKGGALQQKLSKTVRRPNAIRVKEFSEDADSIRVDLLRSTLVLMPSRSEGFGLVGLEALGLGIPTLVSDQSGLAELLRREVPEMASDVIVPITNTPGDRDAWARRMEHVLRDPVAAFQRAANLRRALRVKLTWEKAVAGLLAALDGTRM